jgi:hypothetical protein
MRATIWPGCIDIYAVRAMSEETWERLLDELKAEDVPPLTPAGKRMSIMQTANGQTNATVYRNAGMPDQEIIRIFRKYGIEATVCARSPVLA